MKRCAAAVLIALLAFSSCRRREAAAAAPENPYARTLQPLIEDFVRKQEIPGFAIAVVEDGSPVGQRVWFPEHEPPNSGTVW